MRGTGPTSTVPRVHGTRSVARAGAALSEATAAVVLLHGRGGDAGGMLGLAADWDLDDVAYVVPRAAGNSWYPRSFLAPIAANEPALSSALRLVGEIVDDLADDGFEAARVVIAGFSQGACLGLEFAARHARRYGGVVAFTGGLIGPPDTPRRYPGELGGTPVFLGSSIPDPHVPWERVEETAEVLRSMGAEVDLRGYRGMSHTINREEIDAARALIRTVAGGDSPGGRA